MSQKTEKATSKVPCWAIIGRKTRDVYDLATSHQKAVRRRDQLGDEQYVPNSTFLIVPAEVKVRRIISR